MALRDIFQAPLFINKVMQSAGSSLGNLLQPSQPMNFPVNESQKQTLLNTPSMQLARTLPSGSGEEVPWNQSALALIHGYKTGDKQLVNSALQSSANLVGSISGSGMNNVGKNISRKLSRESLVTATDRLKDFLIENLPKQGTLSSEINPKLVSEAENYLQFLKDTKNPTMNELNQGLEILRLQGKNVKPAQDIALEGAQNVPQQTQARFLKTPDGRFNGSTSMAPLEQEAKKYKTAEEFVKAQELLYHGTSKESATAIRKAGGFTPETAKSAVDLIGSKVSPNAPVSLTLDEATGKLYAGPRPEGGIGELLTFSGKGLKMADEATANKFGNDINKLRKAGYDGYHTSSPHDEMVETVVFNKEKLKLSQYSKSQLTDLWNKANQSIKRKI